MTNTKKILCLIDTIHYGGGAERQMIGLAKLLHERGYQVDLFTYHNQDAYDEIYQNSNIRINSIQVKDNRLSKLMAVKRHIASMGGYDWVIAYKDGPAIIGCLLKLLGGNFRLIVNNLCKCLRINIAVNAGRALASGYGANLCACAAKI